MPIYLDASVDILQRAAHIDGTHLPVGEKGTFGVQATVVTTRT